MRRKSERNKAKSPEPAPKTEKPKRGKLSRKKKKSTSSEKESEGDEGTKKIQETPIAPSKIVSSERRKSGEGNCEDDVEPMWQVMKSESSGNSGEIQKLKICLARSPSTPERPDRSPRGKKRSSHSSVEALSDVSEDKRKSRHRSRRNSGKESTAIQDSSEAEEHVDDSTDQDIPPTKVGVDSIQDKTLVEMTNTNDDDSTNQCEVTATETNSGEVEKQTIVECKVSSEEIASQEIPKEILKEEASSEICIEEISDVEVTENNEQTAVEQNENVTNDKPAENEVTTANHEENKEQTENLPPNNEENPETNEVAISTEQDEQKIEKNEDCNESLKKSSSQVVDETISQPKSESSIEVGSIRRRRWGSRSSKSNKTSTVSISTDSLKNLIPNVEPVSVEDVLLEVKPKEEKQVDKILKEDKLKPNGKYNNNSLDNPKEREILGSLTHRKISVVNEDIPKEQRSPTPPKHKSSSVLYITNLVRPFTLPQLKNLLLRTGKIVENGFWIDKIKSRCYVQYQNEDEAVETRHALHGVTWPVSNPKTLVVDFSSESAMRDAMENSDEDKLKITSESRGKESIAIENDFRRENEIYEKRMVIREWDVGKGEGRELREDGMNRTPAQGFLRDQPDGDRIDKRKRRSRSTSPARKFKKKEDEAPSKLLDDLFRKTKATPCIYWLPLNAETILIKEEQRRKHVAEHERRMEELRRANEEQRNSRHNYHASNRHR